ncbi:MAG TPA: proline--tRNA ligase [Candidatus Bilamarchaeaceae archaeon]|nr:proline--tRNA ligase [Candidatus Bilamarchaeaceae archaeon]
MQVDKEKNFSEWYNTIIKDAQLCDLRYGVKGFVVFLPWAVLTMEKMYRAYEEELQQKGHSPAWFPALIPESYLTKESEHVQGFVPEVLWVTHAGKEKLEERYAMRPTSETAMYTMYSLWIKGRKDLPFKLYQRAQVWRHETKATKPFIRSREFYWVEAHNAFATRAEAEAQVQEDMEITEKALHESWGIPFIFLKRPQWDKFPGAEDTYAADTILPDGRVLQLPSTHMLGQHFAKAFGIRYMDEEGRSEYVWQTCYGPAISRIYAALVAIHGDEHGLVFPVDMAPLQIVIVPIYKGENKKKVDAYCQEVKKKLQGYSVRLDDSENTPGYKYNHWEMRGVPLRLEIGERDMAKKAVILVRRDTRDKTSVAISELAEKIEEVKNKMTAGMRERADARFEKWMGEADGMEPLKKILENQGGFARVPFCTDRMEGKPCAEKIKEACHGNVRGSKFGDTSKPKEKCIACGKKSSIYLYIAKQY